MTHFFERYILKHLFLIVALVAVFMIYWPVDSAFAIEIDKAARTLPLNASGETTTLTEKQLTNGLKKFNKNCAQCHLDGITKTNPDVDLGPRVLALATPPRNNLEALVGYLNNPMTYDGMASLEELHPSTARADLFPKMKNLTEADLVDVAGHILVQPNIIGPKWASGKSGR
ncbi:cytochrome c-550 [Nodosilinea sp. LEGE 07298]|uniref:photosystem II cytochrome c-550 n=1 Tax=Nodosilinea sp. LEGE 07298 TaxID=2777970 RepID=UPI001882F83A|nr:photosystem II cytochrome c-550 [Nodosilinea sp. LEGE 07298]MBE9111998.1 cytochrome c-550 [Nodosilinea sp. LEGE 07298]